MELQTITSENGKWYAVLQNNGERIHTGNIYGWDGMKYVDLKERLKEDYNVSIPTILHLKLVKRTQNRKIYIV